MEKTKKPKKGLKDMKVQLWMRGRAGDNSMKYYQTITPTEFAQVLAFLSQPKRPVR